MSLSDFVPGEWYVVVSCRQCKERHALFHDLSRGSSQIKAIYRWTCPDCNYNGDYDSTELERYQHPLASSGN